MAPSPARAVALEALRLWPTSRDFADALIRRVLRSGPPNIRYRDGTRILYTELQGRDRAFAQELFYGVLRNLTLLDFYIKQLRKTQIDALSRDLLHLGLYQLLFLQMREHAAIFETVELAPRTRRPLINGVLRNAERQRDQLENAAATAPFYIRTSHPEWLLMRWRKSFGEEASVSLACWNNQPAPVYARVNCLKISTEEFAQKYPELPQVAQHPLFFRCDTLPRQAIARGHCYIQDPSTALPVEILRPTAGDAILDACAAPGGKTAYICALTKNQARITACDRDVGRIDLLQKNLARLGATNVAVMQHDWARENGCTDQFDKILLDAPCTNTGVMRRRVDVRWRLRPDEFGRMRDQQLAIAREVIPLLKPGGVFVYSTCSLEREENEDVVRQLGGEFPNLKLDKIESMLPFRDGFDGAFAARFASR